MFSYLESINLGVPFEVNVFIMYVSDACVPVLICTPESCAIIHQGMHGRSKTAANSERI